MALVTGFLHDFTQQPLTGLNPQLKFRRRATAIGNTVFVSKDITTTPGATGDFTVDLFPTSADEWYEVVIEWLDAGGNFIGMDQIESKLHVPAGGGAIGDLMSGVGTLPLLTVLQMPRVISIPFAFTLPVQINRLVGGSYGFAANAESMHTPGTGTTYYVDKATGTSGGTGLSWATAVRTPQQAAAKADCNRMVIRSGVYTRNEVPTVIWNKNVAMVADTGARVIFLFGDQASTLVWTSVGSGTYTTPLTTTNGVFDDAIRAFGRPADLPMAADSASVLATPGTWAAVGGTVYVHLADGRQPDANTYISRAITGLAYGGLATGANISTYMEGIEFLGGKTVGLYAPGANTQLYAKNCKWISAKVTNGLSVYGLAKVALVDCEASQNQYDGFNYHEYNGMNGEVLEVNCTGFQNGKEAGSHNGSTAHESYRIVRVSGRYGENVGANIADVNLVQSFNVGVSAWGSKEAGIDFVGDNMWNDGCFSASSTAFKVEVAGNVRIRDCMYTGALVGNVTTY